VGLVLLPALVVLVRLVIGLHRPFTHYGDNAILEAAVRRVASGTQMLGPYSRFGFHQPGPAYFFVQAPFAWLTGGSPRALFLGATTINFGAALGCVLVVRRWCGERPARLTAAVVSLYIVAATPALVTDPWNPYVLALPLLATILLAAAGAAGSLPAAAGAVVVGSYVVQTHVATALAVAAVGALAVAVAIFRVVFERQAAGPTIGGLQRPRRRLTAVALVAALFAVLWMPPLIEEATHSPGNLTTLAEFFSESHPEQNAGVDHSPGTAARQVGAHLVTFPFGRVGEGAAGGFRLAVASAGLVIAAAVAVLGWRRREFFVVVLAGASVAGSIAAWWSTTRVVGEVLPYLLVWSGALLLPAWIGLGTLTRSGPSRRLPWAPTAAALAAAVPSVVLGWSMLRAPLPPIPDNPEVAAAARLAEPWIDAHAVRRIRIRLGDHAQWPLAAGVIDRLDGRGIRVTVDREWASLFGDQFGPAGTEDAEVWITNRTSPAVPGHQPLGSTATASLWAAPASRSGGQR
jgi:hypothetical protein